ncbi:MAG: tRNA threonylcarbamoyladenosine dehydratase [Clostridiales bacterium]|jgi:tRNA A37 threonylcarbamoyladenosine dehydratase|nr:tRNA threonylcarbamoyladenosine dehydratase [Clostridiales bacterium]
MEARISPDDDKKYINDTEENLRTPPDSREDSGEKKYIIPEWLSRTRAMLGDAAISRLMSATVLVAGLGGVGGHCVEALARAGIGNISVCDCDVFDETNLNRQLLATRENIGRSKALVAAERIRSINPDCRVTVINERITAENAAAVIGGASWVLDCIDDVGGKLALISAAAESGAAIVSCMGTGNKLDPSRFRVTPVEKTHTCPLAKAVRLKCREMNLDCLALWSDEPPMRSDIGVPMSNSWVPAAAGLMMAGHAILGISGGRNN